VQLRRSDIAREIAEEEPAVDLRVTYQTLLTMMVGMRAGLRTAGGHTALLGQKAQAIVQRIEAAPLEDILSRTWIDFVEEEDGLGALTLTAQERAYIEAFRRLQEALGSGNITLNSRSIAHAEQLMRGVGEVPAEVANAAKGILLLIVRQAVRSKLDQVYAIGASRVGSAEGDQALAAVRREVNPITAELQSLLQGTQ